MRTRRVAKVMVCLSMITVPVITVPAFAAKLDVTPSISLDQAYDSNVFNTDGNEKEDFIFRTTPALTISLRMPETTLNLRTSLTSDRYYNYTELNSINSAITLALDSQPPLALSPRLSISPSGHFVQARNSFLRTQLIPSGDPLLPASIATENATLKSRDYGAALRMIYLVTPNVDFSLGGGFTKRQFLNDTAGGNIDSRVLTGDTTLGYRITPLFSPGLFFSTAYNTFENGSDSRTLSAGLTGSYQYSRTVTLNARAGISRTQESDPTGLLDRTTWSPVGLLTFAYVDNTFRAFLSGSFEQAGGGSFGLTTRRTSVNLSVSDRVGDRWWADLSGSYQINRSLDAAATEDLTSATGTAGIRYQVLEWANVRLSGTAFRQWDDGTIGTDLVRYSALLGITVGRTYNMY